MTKRRIKGSGSIYVRKDGRVVGQYEVNGKQRYIYGTTKQDVAAKLTKAIADRDIGLVYDSENLTTAQYLDNWLQATKDIIVCWNPTKRIAKAAVRLGSKTLPFVPFASPRRIAFGSPAKYAGLAAMSIRGCTTMGTWNA
jgi:hypothetical protein